MKSYESGTPAYFATPPVNLIYAYNASLTQLTKEKPSLKERFALHRKASQRIKDELAAIGLKQLALDPYYAANGMTAVRRARAKSINQPCLMTMNNTLRCTSPTVLRRPMLYLAC